MSIDRREVYAEDEFLAPLDAMPRWAAGVFAVGCALRVVPFVEVLGNDVQRRVYPDLVEFLLSHPEGFSAETAQRVRRELDGLCPHDPLDSAWDVMIVAAWAIDACNHETGDPVICALDARNEATAHWETIDYTLSGHAESHWSDARVFPAGSWAGRELEAQRVVLRGIAGLDPTAAADLVRRTAIPVDEARPVLVATKG